MRDDGYIGFLGIDYIVTSDHVLRRRKIMPACVRQPFLFLY